jgi:hypothetical protein
MPKTVTIRQTPTGTVLRWVQEGQIIRLAGTVPEAWLEVIRNQGYTIQAA